MPEGAGGGRPAPELSLVFPGPTGHPVVFAIPEGTTAVGSAADNDLVIEDKSVEPHQVVLYRTGEELELRDLFAGETLVNGEERKNGPIRPGDVLTLGEVRLRVMKVAPGRQTTSGQTRRLATGRLRRGTSAYQAGGAAQDVAGGATQDVAGARSLSAPRARPSESSDEVRMARERDARRSRALARARQLTDELMPQDDFEIMLDRLALHFLEIFSADRAVTLLFEEDGRNPLLVVERHRDGTNEGAGVAQEIIDRCLQVRSVIRVAGGIEGLGGLAAPLITQGRALGLLYFERNTAPLPLAADDVHVMAIIANLSSLLIAPLV